MPHLLVIGPTEGILLGVVVILIFGARRLPDIARSLGEGIREFKKSSKELRSTEEEQEENKTNTN